MENERKILDSIRAELETLPGHLGFYYKNLATGFTFGIREEEAYLAASVIKLPIFLHVLAEAAAGKLSMDEKLTVTEAAKMPGCGALKLMTGEFQVDIATACRMMITISDNTATNLLIRRFGIEALNESFRRMGLTKTVLRRLLFDSEASARGLENTVSPREMGMLLEQVYSGNYVNLEVSRYAMDVLLGQQITHKLEGKLYGAVDVAHKTGEDENLSNDVGILLAEEPFILCFTGHDTPRYPWEDLMRRAAYALCRLS